MTGDPEVGVLVSRIFRSYNSPSTSQLFPIAWGTLDTYRDTNVGLNDGIERDMIERERLNHTGLPAYAIVWFCLLSRAPGSCGRMPWSDHLSSPLYRCGGVYTVGLWIGQQFGRGRFLP